MSLNFGKQLICGCSIIGCLRFPTAALCEPDAHTFISMFSVFDLMGLDALHLLPHQQLPSAAERRLGAPSPLRSVRHPFHVFPSLLHRDVRDNSGVAGLHLLGKIRAAEQQPEGCEMRVTTLITDNSGRFSCFSCVLKVNSDTGTQTESADGCMFCRNASKEHTRALFRIRAALCFICYTN